MTRREFQVLYRALTEAQRMLCMHGYGGKNVNAELHATLRTVHRLTQDRIIVNNEKYANVLPEGAVQGLVVIVNALQQEAMHCPECSDDLQPARNAADSILRRYGGQP